MNSRFLHALTLALVLYAGSSCSRGGLPALDTGDGLGEVIPRDASELPVGANVTVELDQPVGTGSRVGEAFRMHTTQPVVALDRSIVIPEGALVFGHVAALEASRDSTTPGFVHLEFDSLRVGGRRLLFQAVVYRVALPPTTDDTFLRTLPGGATVPPLGRVLQQSTTAAAAGPAISVGVGPNARLPQGTRMTLRSTRRIGL